MLYIRAAHVTRGEKRRYKMTSKKLMINASGLNELQLYVLDDINERAQDYDSGAAGYLDDLMRGGCQSGIVGRLCYYSDTSAFYEQFKNEINSLLYELLNDTGYTPAELFGDKWDDRDPLVLDTSNQNLMAWFGYEETARELAGMASIKL